MCNHMYKAGMRMSSFVVDSMICGHHIYKAIWESVNDEELNTERETGNPHDPLALPSCFAKKELLGIYRAEYFHCVLLF